MSRPYLSKSRLFYRIARSAGVLGRFYLLTDLHVSEKFLLAKYQLNSRSSLIVIINMADETNLVACMLLSLLLLYLSLHDSACFAQYNVLRLLRCEKKIQKKSCGENNVFV